jgi:hypothetical protein
MRKRDSEDDIRKYLPDVATILKRADPARSEQLYREAMDNPELDAALAERRQRLGEDADGEQGAEAMTLPGPVAPTDQAARVSAPSPWAKGAGDVAIDKAALPSATAPKPQEAATVPRVASAEGKRPKRRRGPPKWVFPGMAAIALSPLAMWAVMSRLPPRQGVNALMTSASAQATVALVMDAGAAASSQSSAPAPRSSAPAGTSSALPDTPPAATSVVPSTPAPPSLPRHPGHTPQGAGDDPHGGAVLPAPTKTAEPAPSSSAAAEPSVAPTAPPASSKAVPAAGSSGPQAPPILRPRDE